MPGGALSVLLQLSHTLGKHMVKAELGSSQMKSGCGPYLSRAVKWEVWF